MRSNHLMPMAILLLCSCVPEDGSLSEKTSVPPTDTSLSTQESALAKVTLAGLQAKSFAENREYCGYIVRDAAGQVRARAAVPGDFQSCLANDPLPSDVILASYHTHGAFEYDTPAEFPSVGDVLGDEAEGIDGYISTPGGRLWYVDGDALIVSQLCGIGCLPQDPAFVSGLDDEIAQSYTLEELEALETE